MAKHLGEIKISCSPDGGVKLAVSGVVGPSCTAMTADMERAFGEAEEDTLTSEYYAKPVQAKAAAHDEQRAVNRS